MNLGYWQRAVLLLLLFTYSLLFYFIYTHQQGIDFASFYSAAQLLAMGENPYQILFATYLPTAKKIAANLNPPIVLLLLNPFVQLTYKTALTIWWFLSLGLGAIGAGITFHYLFPHHFLKRNWINLYLLYFSFFATLMDTAIAQIGALLLFTIMLGYHFYCQNRDYAAGIMWGFIIAAKLFPGLLFFYVLLQKRFKVFWVMLFVFLLLTLMPAFIYGSDVYYKYISMIVRVLWYGDSWNASIYGFLFRLFIDARDQTQSILWIKILYVSLFSICLLWYLRKIAQIGTEKTYSFALTLVMMLIMSPFGWLYYFSLLIFPLILTWLIIFATDGNSKGKCLWFISMFMLNFPMDYLRSTKILTIQSKLFFNSFYFYGLALLLYLVVTETRMKKVELNENNTGNKYLPVVYVIIAFGLLVPILSFLGRLFHIDWPSLTR
ncbi:Protein of uncharacterised function (DUF2029) [Legionella lansingensis]|uniref:DUF2029 domain-containing protein n=1 Tax=Legionella lansingensis TaxID=45067 RepID=A0A0W0VGC2_9GAMM|nr:glycosyltransferase family 87 protein [Legionella lansingensis]KTD19130.1 hypothetical protein Llan_2201 [Legionella lansingensis]SNV45593.1 Protein of uncharacterised function (DUF2029) [Legionella lansingensis]